MNYCYVESGVILEGPKALPKSWRNISGLDWLDDADLKALGWLPVRVVDGIPGDKEIEPSFSVSENEVIQTRQWRSYTPEELGEIGKLKESEVRFRRNEKLAASDWTQGKDIPDAISSAWAVYRQQLRDVPSQPGFPQSVNWPVAP